MSNFDMTPKDEDNADGKMKNHLETFAWSHKGDDVILATAGTQGDIHILSLAHSAELRTLEGHSSKREL